MESLIILGEAAEQETTTPTRRIIQPGDPEFNLKGGSVDKMVERAIILPRHLRTEAESEFEGLEPQQIFAKLLEKADADISKIQSLPDAILAEVQKPARERKPMSIQTKEDPTDITSQVTFDANISGESFDFFEEDFADIAKTLPSETYVPFIVQTKPQWKKVFFHPTEGHPIAVKE